MQTKAPVIISAGICILLLIITATAYIFLQPTIPLWYSLTRVEDQLAPKIFVFVFPALAFVIYGVHIVIQKLLRRYWSFTAELYSWGTAVVLVLLGLACIRTVLVVL